MLGRELNAQALNSAAEVELSSAVTGTIVGNIQPITTTFTGVTQVVTTIVSAAFPVQVVASNDVSGVVVGNIQPLTTTFNGTAGLIQTVVSGAFPVQVIQSSIAGTIVGNIQPLTTMFTGTTKEVVTLISDPFPVQVLQNIVGTIVGNIQPLTTEVSGSTDSVVIGNIGIILEGSSTIGDTTPLMSGTLGVKLDNAKTGLLPSQIMAGDLGLTLDTISARLTLDGELGDLPVTDLMYFDDIRTGWLASSLMKIYNQIVDGNPYGVNTLEGMLTTNGLVGRFIWKVVFDNGVEILEEDFAAFTFAFAEAVSQGSRLPGNTDVEREHYLITSMPLTFNSLWRVPFRV